MRARIPEHEVASLQSYIQPLRCLPTLPQEPAMSPSPAAVLRLKATGGAEVTVRGTRVDSFYVVYLDVNRKK